jgi:hypothetical protein
MLLGAFMIGQHSPSASAQARQKWEYQVGKADRIERNGAAAGSSNSLLLADPAAQSPTRTCAPCQRRKCQENELGHRRPKWKTLSRKRPHATTANVTKLRIKPTSQPAVDGAASLRLIRASTRTSRPSRQSAFCSPQSEWQECRRVPTQWSLALIGSASGRNIGEQQSTRAEALSIRRLEGSRWQGGRVWSYKLVWMQPN